MLQIVEVQYQSDQGMSGPYVCKAEDGHRYFVKGRHSGRESQVCELLGWHLATAFGLPVPPGVMLEMSEDLFDELPRELRGIGQGVFFGSQEAPSARWFELADVGWAKRDFRRDLLVFDYWVCNEDRGSHNPNLLFMDDEKKIIVIDHNRIFAKGMTDSELVSDHIFADEWPSIAGDLASRAEYADRLEGALLAWPEACNNIPPAWSWENDEQDIPVDFDVRQAHKKLCRFKHLKFWEAL